jgi:RNA polymerase sigma factor (sigma-70 family)
MEQTAEENLSQKEIPGLKSEEDVALPAQDNEITGTETSDPQANAEPLHDQYKAKEDTDTGRSSKQRHQRPDKHVRLTREQKEELLVRFKQGDKAAEAILAIDFLERAGRLVTNITKNKDDGDDLVQGAYLAVNKFFKKFDPSKIENFGPFYERIIRNALRKEMSTLRGRMALSRNDAAILKQLREAKKSLQSSLGREPTPQELGNYCSLNAQKLRHYEILSDNSILASLDDESEHGEGHTLLDELTYKEEEEQDHDFSIDQARSYRWIAPTFSKLTKNEKMVINLRFGRKGNPSLALVGKLLSFSKQKVYRLEDSALQKLRAEAMSFHPERFTRGAANDSSQLGETESTSERLQRLILKHVSKFNAQLTKHAVVTQICSELPDDGCFFTTGTEKMISHEQGIDSLVEELLADGRLIKLKSSGYLAIAREDQNPRRFPQKKS